MIETEVLGMLHHKNTFSVTVHTATYSLHTGSHKANVDGTTSVSL